MRTPLFVSLFVACSIASLPATLPAEDARQRTVASGDPVVWLQHYLQIDTTNPPGNEARAAAFLGALLDHAGIEHRLLTSPGGRSSLYARLPATTPSAGGAVVLVHHMDVVPASAGWKQPPFSGRRVSGRIWGRGAIDTKGLGIAQLAALIRYARRDAPRHRDVIYLAVADEETGGKEGVGWLLDAHPELFEGVSGVINEGGVNRVASGRVAWWGIEIDQKRPLWLRLTARGRPGHGSMLLIDSASHRLVPALGRLIDRPLRFEAVPSARRFLGALAALEGGSSLTMFERLDATLAGDAPQRGLPPGWLSVLSDTLQVTRLEGSRGTNVISAVAHAEIDMRLLPNRDNETVLAALRETLGPQIEVEVLLDAPPASPSPTDHPLYRSLERVLGLRAPVLPAMIAGVTDSRYFRQRGIAAYGLLPFVLTAPDMRGVHAADESIPETAFLRGIETMLRILTDFAGTPP